MAAESHAPIALSLIAGVAIIVAILTYFFEYDGLFASAIIGSVIAVRWSRICCRIENLLRFSPQRGRSFYEGFEPAADQETEEKERTSSSSNSK